MANKMAGMGLREPSETDDSDLIGTDIKIPGGKYDSEVLSGTDAEMVKNSIV